MEFGVDESTVIWSVGVLLFLSIVTIIYCKSDPMTTFTERSFLFEGKSFKYSVMSNIGAIFSVTYFLGAIIIYANIYKIYFLLILILVLLVTALFLLFIIKRINASLSVDDVNGLNDNIFLKFVSSKLSSRDFAKFVVIMLLIYSGLLIEEFAVSRLAINTLFPFNIPIKVIIMGIIIFVIYAYIYIGGFRAVLNSDYIQSIVIIAFIFVLLYFIVDPNLSMQSYFTSNQTRRPIVIPLIFFSIFGLAWFILSIDFYSRLNIKTNRTSRYFFQKNLVYISLIGILLVMIFGTAFSITISNKIPLIDSPTNYTRSIMSFFMTQNSRIISSIFLISLFCMIFTTISTLILTLLQLGYYYKPNIIKRENISYILVVTVFLSSLLRQDAVSAIGIFVGSLMIIPFVELLKLLFPRLLFLYPRTNSYLFLTLSLSCTIFIYYYVDIETNFELHFCIPAIVVFSTVLSLILLKIFETLKGLIK